MMNTTSFLNVEVDYSTLDQFLYYLQLISSICAPLISLITISRYFYILYNFFWGIQSKRHYYYLKAGVNFLLMIPLIGQEFLLATEIFSSLEKKV